MEYKYKIPESIDECNKVRCVLCGWNKYLYPNSICQYRKFLQDSKRVELIVL